MAVSLATAKSTHAALKGGAAADLFGVVKANVKVHDSSHFSRQNATAALSVNKPSCGYYYKTHSREMLRHKKGTLDDKPVEPMSRKAAKNWSQYTAVTRLPVDANECLTIVHQALAASGSLYKQATRNPNQRFTLIADIPNGYGGVTLYRDGSAEAECTKVALVIVAGDKTNAALVTHFPCAQTYIDGLEDL